jgi:hypothetical protein
MLPLTFVGADTQQRLLAQTMSNDFTFGDAMKYKISIS